MAAPEVKAPVWPADAVSRRPVSELTPYAANARIHSPEQVGEIARSIREFGFTVPVLVDEAGGIIAGHGRVMAAKELGLDDVPVMVASGWSAEQKRAYVLADNKIALNSGWDDDLLKAELAALSAANFDLGVTGFDMADLSALGLVPGPVDEVGHDEVSEPPGLPVSGPGDLWVLGDHRVLCGDCRSAANVARLCGLELINVAFTSPPYAQQREYDQSSGFRPIPPDEFVEWFGPVQANVARHLAPDGSWFVNIKPSCEGLDTSLYVMDLVIAHVRQWGWHFATEFCWERNGVPKSVTQRFKNQFEPIYQFALGRWKMRPDAVRHESPNVPRAGGPGSGETSWGKKQGGRGASSVSGSFGAAKKRRNGTSKMISDVQGRAHDAGEYIGPGLAYPGNRLPTFAESHSATGHAAAFPVGLPEFFCNAFSDPGDIVFDPFCGSGSTIIAAQRTGRRGLGCEISPTYVDVIVRRWESFTGKAATLEGDGRTFAEISAERAPEVQQAAQ